MNSMTRTAAVILLSLSLMPLATARGDSGTPESDGAETEQQKLIAEAEAAKLEAQRSIEEAHRAAQSERQALQEEEMERMRAELSRVHEQLREVSRQVAQAHRELGRAEHVRVVHPRDRAILGVLLGTESDQGVRIIGVSPDGPAERAGLQQGDVLVSVNEVKLGEQERGARAALFEVMDSVEPGEELSVGVLRDGSSKQFKLITGQRESKGWQTVVRLPEVPDAPDLIVDEIRIPEIDEAKLAARIKEINEQLQGLDLEHAFTIDEETFSHIGEQAMRDADFWFGLPQARGLELAKLNPQLGKYFKADSGVLVIQARDDNAYGLESGDVIQRVDGTEVNAPSDLLRALRDAEPGTDIELKIKRDRKDQDLKAKVPENRLGLTHLHRWKSPAAAPASPKAD